MSLKGQRGFTLVEVLLAAGIFSVIAVSLYVTLSGGIALSRRSQDVENLYGEARWALESLTADLENMVAYRHNDFLDVSRSGFVGDEQGLSLLIPTGEGLRFVRYAVLSPEAAERYEVLIHEAAGTNETVVTGSRSEERLGLLVRDERPFALPSGLDEASMASAEILSRHVREGSLRFSYAYRKKDESLEWRDQWTEGYLPAGVRVEITFWDPRSPSQPFSVVRRIFVPKGSWGEGEG